MSLTSHISHDSLPYIEPTPSASELGHINALIASELPPSHTTTPHPSLPVHPTPSFPPLFSTELTRVASSQPLTGGIDLTRYEPPSQPSEASLHAAYTSSTHLGTRLTNLSLLAEFGKNAWLIHNSDLEAVLKRLEEELMAAKTEVEVVNKARKGMQVGVEAEMRRLEERWRRGVGRVLEVEVAAERVRREVVERRRAGGGSEAL
ncbi:hypothetical protein EX30DRAFT_360649 [Ascodesmis nigricans]|uniref:Breast carcinoma amplified sequence 2 n=1 Tax=Ascodesmis nigricans TaxID=341454 RepID=A0A4S2N5Q9_9PEZI|nr:hypothetical protein EX30DRAFT_360649 [Ascodesmis nigricans]